VWKYEGYGPLRRPSLGRKSNIKMNLRNAGCGGMNCIVVAEDRDRDGLL
jgi:hypothetical protein